MFAVTEIERDNARGTTELHASRSRERDLFKREDCKNFRAEIAPGIHRLGVLAILIFREMAYSAYSVIDPIRVHPRIPGPPILR